MDYKGRKERLIKLLKEKDLSGYLTNNPAIIEYFTGIHATTNPPKDLLLVVFKDEFYLITPLLESEYLKNFAKNNQIIEWKPNQKIEDIICKLIEPKEKIGYESFIANYKLIAKLMRKGVRFRDIRDSIIALRSVKEKEEIEIIKKAVEITEKALKLAKELINEGGYTEEEVAKEVYLAMIKNGCEGLAFDPIIATGENAAYPHYIPSNIRIKQNAFTLVDIGGRYKSYCADLTRTFLNGKINDKMRNVYNAVREALDLSISKIKDGISCKDVDLVARNYLKTKNLDQYFIHSLGHGIGIEIHELPTISMRSKSKLLKNMIVTIEPGVYIKNELGIRLEEDVLVLEEGAEVISSFPLDF